MNALENYENILQRIDIRKHVSERFLRKLQQQRDGLEKETQHLKDLILLQKNIYSMHSLDDATIDRNQLMAWLRKNAVAKRKLQDLHLKLEKQEERNNEHNKTINFHTKEFSQLESKRQKYETKILDEKRYIYLHMENIEESEIEEIILWNR